MISSLIKSCLLMVGMAYSSIYAQADTASISRHLDFLVNHSLARNYKNVERLDEVAEYIHQHLSGYSNSVEFQSYIVDGVEYKNVIARFGPKNARKIVIGAHYDVCGNQPGADDNASGIVGLLELSRLIDTAELKYCIELVAYTLEEPPFFRTTKMGSYVHAENAHNNSDPIYGMIVLEMIGYFDSDKGSQEYPIKPLKLIYGGKGDYITVVKKFRGGNFARKFNRKFQRNADLRAKAFTGPKSLPGIDFSDHLNYWKFGYSAVMITDTAFYRNKNYHEITDTKETLDLIKLALVVDSLNKALQTL